MNYLREILICTLCFSPCSICCAQQTENLSSPNKYRAVHWDIDNGLSQGETYCMLKDADGFLWIGTNFGLNRFDGSTFKTYFHDPAIKNSLIDNATTFGMVEDSLHNIWTGTPKGLSRYDRRADTFTNIFADSSIIEDNAWTIIPFWATK
jgi:ligand-binding sensor domain-containing protein